MTRFIYDVMVGAMCAGLLLGGCSQLPETPRACSKKTAELEHWTDQLAQEGRGLPAPEGWQGVPMMPRGKPLDLTRTLLVGTASVRLNDVEIDEHELGAALRTQREMAVQLLFPLPTELALAVDRRVPWGRVVELANVGAGSGFTEISWTFPARSVLTQPTTTAAPSQTRGTPWIAIEQGLGETCPIENLRRAERSLGGISQVGKEVANALRQCGCRADERRVRAAFWRLLGRDQGGPATTFSTTFATDRDGAVRIEAPANRPFAEVAPALVHASRRHERVVLAAR